MSGFDRAATFSLLRLICLLPAAGATGPANQLAGHPSPCLALHGHDPVAWQEWNVDTTFSTSCFCEDGE